MNILSFAKTENEFIKNFRLEQLIGRGAFSQVRIGIERATQKKYAIKIIDQLKCRGKEDMIESEVAILKMIRHVNIIQLFDIYTFNNINYLIFIRLTISII